MILWPNPVPSLCLWSRVTGLRCPGCGTLHALRALLALDFTAAWNHNPLSFATLPLCAGLWAHWTFRLWRPLRGAREA